MPCLKWLETSTLPTLATEVQIPLKAITINAPRVQASEGATLLVVKLLGKLSSGLPLL